MKSPRNSDLMAPVASGLAGLYSSPRSICWVSSSGWLQPCPPEAVAGQVEAAGVVDEKVVDGVGISGLSSAHSPSIRLLA